MNWHAFLARLLGYTFIIKYLERGEDKDISLYSAHVARMPELSNILAEEQAHEQKLMDILDEERLHYVGDMVLGMNDALVELTGALAGYTLAMQTQVIAMAGLITGVSRHAIQAASGYLSSREAGEEKPRNLFAVYGNRVSYYGCASHHTVSPAAAGKIYIGARDYAADRAGHYRELQLLYSRCEGQEIQAQLFDYGGHQPWRSGCFIHSRARREKRIGHRPVTDRINSESWTSYEHF